MFWDLNGKLLAEGKIKTHPVIVKDRGLAGIPDGLPEVAQGKISAAKLVYRVDDTPANAYVTSTADAEKVVGGPDLTNSQWMK
ncbi:hypothetical protein OCU04_005170 [Sclerotinia nivalis]|uniref:Uncharacterized protein n=1 Tax=Sclerotinia nivalis TaxID=352851 RepID=A0A9X0DMJ3_9HELO|nr:hypothetical protein OCU04_005170 [Sclerotinia nivalis]